jgi:hypothetical protein
MATSSSQPSIGESILRQYAQHLDPIDSGSHTHAARDLDQPEPGFVNDKALSGALTPVSESLRNSYIAHHPTVPVPKPLLLPKSYLAHRKNTKSIDIPRQTIMKALASRRPSAGPNTAP